MMYISPPYSLRLVRRIDFKKKIGVHTVPRGKLLRPLFFNFFVSGQPASVYDIQGIRLQSLPNEAFEDH